MGKFRLTDNPAGSVSVYLFVKDPLFHSTAKACGLQYSVTGYQAEQDAVRVNDK